MGLHAASGSSRLLVRYRARVDGRLRGRPQHWVPVQLPSHPTEYLPLSEQNIAEETDGLGLHVCSWIHV